MAGRGWSSGAGSLTVEQRTALGIVRDGHPVSVAPPPLYGKLEGKPGPLPDDPDTLYLVSLKQKLVTQLNAKSKENMEKWWPYMPPELTPVHKENPPSKKAKKRKNLLKEDFVTKMSALEEAEKKTSAKETAKETEKKPDAEMDDGEEFEDDNEMDEGTDYADNYFDNGEGFDDDDDNSDDNDDGSIFLSL